MSGEPRETLARALGAAAGPSVVRTAFAMPDAQRAAIQDALNESFSADVQLRFETAPDLIGGIELATDGHRTAWSIADYLGSLETSIRDMVARPDAVEPSRAVAPEPPAASSRQ
jgi:F-type H+-transporting ATPase subunit b